MAGASAREPAITRGPRRIALRIRGSARLWSAIFALACLLSPSAADEPAAGDALDTSAMAVGTEPPVAVDESKPLRRDPSAKQTATRGSAADSRGGSWIRTSASLAGVVGLVLFLAWGYRAATGNSRALLTRSRRTSAIEILGRTQLAPRQSICLVRIGTRAVLVGVSGEGLRTLDVITDAAAVAQLAGQANSTARDAFNQCLKSETREFEAAEADQSHADLAASTIRTLAAKQKLTGVADRLRAAGT